MAMFKSRNESDESSGSTEGRREPPTMKAEPDAATKPSTGGAGATIGRSVRIQGDISGEEDLTIQGMVEGSISLKNHLVTIGKEGRVSATVNAKVIRIEGTVEGDLRGNEQIIMSASGNVRGNMSAPRVTIEDGCRFKGSIDMDGAESSGQPAPAASTGQKPADRPQYESGRPAPAASASGRPDTTNPGKTNPGKAI